MKRFMSRFGSTDSEAVTAPEPRTTEHEPARFAEGTGERDRPTINWSNTVGGEPLLYSDFEDTLRDQNPSQVVYDLRATVDFDDDHCKTIPGWSPDPEVFSSACKYRPVTSVADRIRCHSSFQRRSAFERLLDPNLTYAEPFTPIP
jgi:hypothetical protein